MNIQISGQHLEVTQAISDHIHNKFERISKHFNNISNVHIFLKVEKTKHFAEATLHINNHDIVATAHSDDMYSTINTLVDKVDRQIMKHKEKLTSHH